MSEHTLEARLQQLEKDVSSAKKNLADHERQVQEGLDGLHRVIQGSQDGIDAYAQLRKEYTKLKDQNTQLSSQLQDALNQVGLQRQTVRTLRRNNQLLAQQRDAAHSSLSDAAATNRAFAGQVAQMQHELDALRADTPWEDVARVWQHKYQELAQSMNKVGQDVRIGASMALADVERVLYAPQSPAEPEDGSPEPEYGGEAEPLHGNLIEEYPRGGCSECGRANGDYHALHCPEGI